MPDFARAADDAEARRRGGGGGGAARAGRRRCWCWSGCCSRRGSSIVIAPGFEGEKRELTIRLVRILFPGAGLLVLSAWCLGVLNSHGRFFLSYAAPVIWNLAIIVALVLVRRTHAGLSDSPSIAAWGSVGGQPAAVRLQLPAVLRLLDGLRPAGLAPRRAPAVRAMLANFGPVFVGRGVVQISAYVDTAARQPAARPAPSPRVSYAQVLYTLPGESLRDVGLGRGAAGDVERDRQEEERAAPRCRARLDGGAPADRLLRRAVGRRSSWRSATSSPARCTRSGEFTREMTLYVWAILAGAAVGLLPSTLGRLYASTLLRAARHPHAAPVRPAPGRPVHAAGIPLRAADFRRALGLERALGRRRDSRSPRGSRRWVEYALLRRRAAPADRRDARSRRAPGRGSGRRPRSAAAAAWLLRGLLPAQHPICSGRCWCSARSAWCIFGVDRGLGCAGGAGSAAHSTEAESVAIRRSDRC